MDCTKCGLPIEGGRDGGSAIVVKYHWSDFLDPERATDVRHAVCVGDPLSLPNVRDHRELRKWAVAMIRDISAAASAQVRNHNDLVDALEEVHPGVRVAYERIQLGR